MHRMDKVFGLISLGKNMHGINRIQTILIVSFLKNVKRNLQFLQSFAVSSDGARGTRSSRAVATITKSYVVSPIVIVWIIRNNNVSTTWWIGRVVVIHLLHVVRHNSTMC
jgi:hypothetical protein